LYFSNIENDNGYIPKLVDKFRKDLVSSYGIKKAYVFLYNYNIDDSFLTITILT
tara:strand:+ start:29008 stop:29169 length:162 start_codon:yes stop_codon:yes gene_type:complete